jgi:hypothetical protein
MQRQHRVSPLYTHLLPLPKFLHAWPRQELNMRDKELFSFAFHFPGLSSGEDRPGKAYSNARRTGPGRLTQMQTGESGGDDDWGLITS